MRLKRLERTDRETYLEMSRAFYHSSAVLHPVPDSYLERTFEEVLASRVYADGFLIEDDDGTVMGYALTAKTVTQEAGGQVVWVEELYILPQHQGQGAGTQALRLLEAEYPHCARFRLEIEPENTDAERLYRRLGYQALEYRQMMKEPKDKSV